MRIAGLHGSKKEHLIFRTLRLLLIVRAIRALRSQTECLSEVPNDDRLRTGLYEETVETGEIQWTDGMLYPVLHRLEEQGLIEGCWRTAENGRKRKYYSLKAPGRKALAKQREQWRVVNLTLGQLWGT